MSHRKLPKFIKLNDLCHEAPPEGSSWHATLRLDEVEVATELLQDPNVEVMVDLHFSTDPEGFPCVQGQIQVVLTLICQRCLEPMQHRVDAPFCVSPVSSDAQAERLPARYEPLWTSQGEISTTKWIAEELHLAVPLAPRHEVPCVDMADIIEKLKD